MSSPVSWLLRYASRLRYPHLFLLTLGLFALDLLVPDFVPLADEILLGLMSLLLGTWKERGATGATGDEPVDKPPEKNVTPGNRG